MATSADCECKKKTGSHISEWIVGAATGDVVGWVWFGDRAATAPAEGPPAMVRSAGQIPGVDTMLQPYLDRIGDQIGAQIGPILQHDEAFQRRVGTAVGAEIARQYMVPVYVIAGAVLAGGIAAIYAATRR